jgi:hypothetical protein
MASGVESGKLYPLFTLKGAFLASRSRSGPVGVRDVVGLAIAIFIALFGWGEKYFGWHDPSGKVQLALFTSFVLGALCGYRSKG